MADSAPARTPDAVLFACNRNRVRSPMAEALLKLAMGDQIFVAEGDGEYDEERDHNTYTRWFKVSRKLYDAGWTAALGRLRAEPDPSGDRQPGGQ